MALDKYISSIYNIIMKIIPEPIEFEWDDGNADKNRVKHGISTKESEEPFFDQYRKLWKDIPHSGKEWRYILLGATKSVKILFISFTIRSKRVRVISARPAHKKERIMYENAKKTQ